MKKFLNAKSVGSTLISVGGVVLGLTLGVAVGGWPGWLAGLAVAAIIVGIAFIFASIQNERQRSRIQSRQVASVQLKEDSRSTYHLEQIWRHVARNTGQVSALTGVLTTKEFTSAPSALAATPLQAPKPAPAPVSKPAPTKQAYISLPAGSGEEKRLRTEPLSVTGERLYRPITGWTAQQWIKGRQQGSPFLVEERDPAQRTTTLPFASDIPVVMIADEFTFNSFKPEFDTHRLHPDTWRSTMESVQPRLFICESAWQGGSPSTRPWQGKIYSSARMGHENRAVLLEILEYCRAKNIPTVFWNKEDPTHYGDRINDFIRTAYLFDYIFTTAEECIERYEYDLKRSDVYALPFAVQPKMFNPLKSEPAKDNANFAGTWYAMYPERCAAAEQMMDLVLQSGRDLVIFDRMFDSPSPMYRYPEKYTKFVRPSIPYQDTAEAYRRSRFGITLNTVVDSKTMFARRIFELAASGSVVLSNYSLGVESFFGDSVIFAERDPDRFLELTEDGYRDLQRRSTKVGLANTYTHRAEQILNTVGIQFVSRFEKPAALGLVQERADVERLRTNADEANLGDLVTVVSKEAEDALQMSLMRDRLPGVMVVGQEELERGDYRTRNLLATRGVVVAGTGLRFPDAGDVEYLGLHSTYAPNLAVQLAEGPQQPFSTGVASLGGSFIPASSFRSAMADRSAEMLFV